MVRRALLCRADIAHELRETTSSESARIDAIRSGDEPAFEAVFREYYRGLCALASRIVGCDETAEEVVQSVLLRIWRQREDLAISITLAGYLHNAVRNGALTRLRRLRLERRWQEQASAEGVAPLMGERPPQPDEWTRSAELSTAIRDAIEQLPPRCQQAYRLRREKQLSYAEIARRMGISAKTVEVQIGAAHRSLRARLAVWLE